MPRLFTGLEVPTQISVGLSTLRGGLPGAYWIEPADYHVTLRFIGDVDEGTAREIDGLLAGIRRKAFDLEIVGLDAFGGAKPRSVYAAVAASRALVELQAEHERLMQRVGLPPEGRNYRPHVTLARLRDATSRQVADYLGPRGGFRSPVFRVPRFVLFSSRASVGGGPYVVEAAYPLTT